MSLKQRIAFSIAFLSFAPNIAVVLSFWLNTEGTIPATMLLWALLLAGLASLVGYAVATLLMRPLDELTRALQYLKVTERALFDLSLPKPQEAPPQEIAGMRQRFNELMLHIRELAEAREAVFATLAHDLKTPILASMRAIEYLETADDIGPQQRIQVLREVGEEHKRTYWLIENLLTASRLETQRPLTETINNRAVLEETRLRFGAEGNRHGIAIEVEGGGHSRADRGLLERALSNLTSNAIRHARSKVVLRAADGYIEVEDDGPGLPDDIDTLSQPFRSQRLRGVRSGSAGLGLYVARKVAETHGGKLESLAGVLGGACLRLKLEK